MSPQAHPLPEEARGREDFSQLLRSFEQWLQKENAKLAKAIAARTATVKDSKTKKIRLQVRGSQGQSQLKGPCQDKQPREHPGFQ